MSDEYLVKVGVRNNLLLRRMKELGIESQTELSRRSGLRLADINALVCMRRRPVNTATGEWTDAAYALSSALQTEPEDLWTEKQRGMALERSTREISMSEDAVMQLASGNDTQRLAQDMLTTKALDRAMETLNPREQLILRARFYDERTLSDVGDELGISRGRTQQIERKALRKLKHPSRSAHLRPLIQEGE